MKNMIMKFGAISCLFMQDYSGGLYCDASHMTDKGAH